MFAFEHGLSEGGKIGFKKGSFGFWVDDEEFLSGDDAFGAGEFTFGAAGSVEEAWVSVKGCFPAIFVCVNDAEGSAISEDGVGFVGLKGLSAVWAGCWDEGLVDDEFEIFGEGNGVGAFRVQSGDGVEGTGGVEGG